MKKLIPILIFAAFTVKAQTGCNASSFNPITVCPLNSTISISQSMQTDIIYVCGQNSVVYDTLNPSSIKYRQVFINSGGSYYFKSTLTNNNVTVFAKNGSFCTIEAGSNTGPFFYFNQESTATLTNLSSGTVTVNNCSSIAGPTTVNCVASSVEELNTASVANVWPNPSSGKLRIKTPVNASVHAVISDFMGKIVFEEKWIGVQQKELSLASLSQGIYSLILKINEGVETKKIVIAK